MLKKVNITKKEINLQYHRMRILRISKNYIKVIIKHLKKIKSQNIKNHQKRY